MSLFEEIPSIASPYEDRWEIEVLEYSLFDCELALKIFAAKREKSPMRDIEDPPWELIPVLETPSPILSSPGLEIESDRNELEFPFSEEIFFFSVRFMSIPSPITRKLSIQPYRESDRPEPKKPMKEPPVTLLSILERESGSRSGPSHFSGDFHVASSSWDENPL